MSSPLCPSLYRRLQNLFGTVLISNEGEEMYGVDRRPAMGSWEGRDSFPDIEEHGEYYRVACPICQDSRYRLYINYRFSEFPWLAVCYNEQCFSTAKALKALYLKIFNSHRPHKLELRPGTKVQRKLEQVVLPGHCVPVNELERLHVARTYLEGRSFDADQLASVYQLSYCVSGSPGYKHIAEKLVIPIYMFDQLVGWQARFPFERNWKACSFPKYYDLPGMAKRLMLYNHDVARRRGFAVITEGVTDAWRVGTEGMALLGRTLSAGQRTLLAYPPFRDMPIVVLLDSDAYLESEEITYLLKKDGHTVIEIRLAGDVDPGGLSTEVLRQIIFQSASKQGVTLKEIGPHDSAISAEVRPKSSIGGFRRRGRRLPP